MCPKRVVCFWLALGLLVSEMPTERCQAADKKPFIVVFDFISEFDNGKWGKWSANNIRKKATRKREYEILDDLTFRDVLSQMDLKYKFDDPIAHFVKIGAEGFQADVIAWGKVEEKRNLVPFFCPALLSGEVSLIYRKDES